MVLGKIGDLFLGVNNDSGYPQVSSGPFWNCSCLCFPDLIRTHLEMPVGPCAYEGHLQAYLLQGGSNGPRVESLSTKSS